MKLTLVAWSLVALAGLQQTKDASDLSAIRPYRSWTQATTGWNDMTPFLATLCSNPSKELQHPNPHVPRVFRVFVNAKAKQTMSSGKKPYPVGSIIVKEKYPRIPTGERYSPAKDPDPASKPELLTVMVKRADGWEWFAASGDFKQIARDNGTCRSCHESQKSADYVFTTSKRRGR